MEKEFSEEETKQFRTLFGSFDVNGDGRVTVGELKDMMSKIGEKTVSDTEVTEVMKSSGCANGSFLTWEDFLKVISEIRKGKESKFSTVLQKAATIHLIGGLGDSVHSFAQEEKRAFVDYVNGSLASDAHLKGVLPLKPETASLFEAVRSGVLLCKLINIAVPETIDIRVVNLAPKNAFQVNENHCLALNSARAIGCMVVNIHPSDLVEGRVHLVLGLLWQIIRISLVNRINLKQNPELVRLLHEGEELSQLLKLPPEQILLRWVNYHLVKGGSARRIANFSADVKDSEVYTILLFQVSRGVTSKDALGEKDLLRRAEIVVAQAAKIDAAKFILPKDIVSGNPKLNLAFVANLFNTHPALDPISSEEKTKWAEMMDFDQEGTREERSFRYWINSLGVEVTNLFEDVRDGVVLLKVFDVIKPGLVSWKGITTTPKSKFQKLELCNCAVTYGKSLKFSLVGIGGTDILDGNKKLILALVWQMMRFHILEMLRHLGSGGKEISDEDLIRWANAQVVSSGKKTSIASFHDKSIASGRFLVDLCAAVSPGAVNPDLVCAGDADRDHEMNAKYAISIARKLGATLFLLWEDVTEVRPKMIMTFVGSMMLAKSAAAKGASKST